MATGVVVVFNMATSVVVFLYGLWCCFSIWLIVFFFNMAIGVVVVVQYETRVVVVVLIWPLASFI